MNTHHTDQPKNRSCGAGPTGISAAYDLARLGYQVKLFDSLPLIGETLVTAIPTDRFPHSMLEHDYFFYKSLALSFNFLPLLVQILPFFISSKILMQFCLRLALNELLLSTFPVNFSQEFIP